MELFKASNQWATRPPDERFWSIKDAAAQCQAYREQAVTAVANYADLRVEARDDELVLIGKENYPAQLTHYAFGQLCGRGEPMAPPHFLRQLKPTLAAQVLNSCLKQRAGNDNAYLLFHQNGKMLLRAALSERYERLWNNEIFERCLDLPEGWKVPPARPANDDPRARPATAADLLECRRSGLSVKEGDLIAPAGIYASDHDMFLFMVNEGIGLDGGHLNRGFFLWNSEVGDKSFGFCSFLYDHVCGNHIVWNAKGVSEFRIRHLKDVRYKGFRQLSLEMRKYSDASVSDDEAVIESAKKMVLGNSKAEVVEALLGIVRKKRLSLPQKTLDAAYDVAEARVDRYGDPRTLWAQVSGLTEHSQTLKFAEHRNELDREAGKLLSVAF